ncbi:coiled-coil domain-containing protein 93 isoform X1 [Neodiprion virginianus]|uniref:coiled-coil domain-containing protein 93 isoform X1 n=1 Tax=Neodiprion virginianus TaxID=2961670 RepID=UPI001EE77991|nr:coiled-coil domain-containing protein 93 isoform X1 [Neodiprion virginianus]
MFVNASKRSAKTLESAEADVREDEEQAVKFQEIIDLLVAAGYFRARIKGLTSFDKVVGGMTWCIESCNFDVDVDLLFQENLTIGQKIALTEKIVAMLPKMNCPHRIEPHQIQGLDCIHIFPIIQWLVKRSMEMREVMGDFVRSYAVSQFDKNYTFAEDSEMVAKKESMASNLKTVKQVYKPQRYFRRKDPPPEDEVGRVQSTLLEYGSSSVVSLSPSEVIEDTQADDATSSAKKAQEEEKRIDELMKNMSVADDNEGRLSASAVGTIVGMQAQEIVQAAEHYAALSADIEGSSVEGSFGALAALEKQKATLEERKLKMEKDKENLSSKVSEATEKLRAIEIKKEEVEKDFRRMEELETEENKSVLLRLQKLLLIHDSLKEQEHKFREQCKSDLAQLQSLVPDIEGTEPGEAQCDVSDYEVQKERVNKLRLQVAKKNRAIASLTRQLDDVPGRSELTQYQRRFLELYNQVSAKHKETKQYYTLYNTLDDTKLYLSKELALLNSIQDNYNKAMASASGKEQFLKQFEAIVSGIKQNKTKVEKRCAEERARRDSLSQQLVTLVEQQRKYVAAVRQLTIECRKNEALLAQLRGP